MDFIYLPIIVDRFLVAFFLLYVVHDDVLGAGMSYVNVAYPKSALTCETDAAPVDNSTNALSDNQVDIRRFTNAGLQFKVYIRIDWFNAIICNNLFKFEQQKLEVSVSDEASPVEKSVKTADVKYQVKRDSIPLNSQVWHIRVKRYIRLHITKLT